MAKALSLVAYNDLESQVEALERTVMSISPTCLMLRKSLSCEQLWID